MNTRRPDSKHRAGPHAPTRRDFLKQTSLLVAGAWAVGVLPWATGRSFAADDAFPVVETAYGKVRGMNVAGIKTYKGIHYGGTTAGKNRFMPPAKPPSWAGVRDAFAFGQISPQILVNPEAEYVQMINWDQQPGGMGEDCLVLNVWTPGLNDGVKRPVFVSLHGGGYSIGSGSASGFNGDPLARFGDAVVVTVNHRLAALGYLHLGDLGGAPEFATSGVVGMMDLVAALEWVRDNVENFGGDPNNVMIFGQSGGGAKTSMLLGMPSAKGLFHRAGVQSGSALRAGDREAAAKSAEQLLDKLGIDKRNLSELQNVPWDKILAAQGGGRYGPIMDGNVIPRHPFDPTAPEVSADVPMIIGTTLEDSAMRLGGADIDEAGLAKWAQSTLKDDAERVLSAYARVYANAKPSQIQARILTDRRGRRGATAMAERKAALGSAPAYLYIWAWPSPAFGGKYGAIHGVDVGLTFHNARGIITGNGPEARKMADIMASVWVAFARTGDPNCKLVPPWPAYTPETRPTMIFNTECRVENDPAKELRLLWDEISA